jgi:hypothetical protein
MTKITSLSTGSRTVVPGPATPYDNAGAERFMRTLKEEERTRKAYTTIEARAKIGIFIANADNRRSAAFRALLLQTPGRVRKSPISARLATRLKRQTQSCHSNAVSQPRGAFQWL